MCLYSMAINVLISITKTIKQTLTVLLRHGFNIFLIFNGHFRNRLIGGTYHKQGRAYGHFVQGVGEAVWVVWLGP